MLQENEALIMILKMELFSSFLSHQPEHILFFFSGVDRDGQITMLLPAVE